MDREDEQLKINGRDNRHNFPRTAGFVLPCTIHYLQYILIKINIRKGFLNEAPDHRVLASCGGAFRSG